ncbi:putative signal peptide-containing protein with transmembrane domain [Cryptosporidium parvum]
MRLYSYFLLVIFYFVCCNLHKLDTVDCIKLHKGANDNVQTKDESKEGSKDMSEEEQSTQETSSDSSNNDNDNDISSGTEEKSDSETEKGEDNKSGTSGAIDEKNENANTDSKEEQNNATNGQDGSLLKGDKMEDESIGNQIKDAAKEEDEKNELKKLEEFKKSETLDKEPEIEKEPSENHVENEKKYEIESEIISKTSTSISEVRMTDENEFTIDHPTVNQVINKVIQPSTEEKQLQIELKDDFEPESGIDESKQTKSVILTFDLSSEDLFSKISLISDSKLTLTRYIGMNPQKVKITLVDPTIRFGSQQTRLSELAKYESMQFELNQKVPGKADVISLSEISNQIPIILQQHNTTTLRFLLEAVDSQTQFGILSNMDGVGPTIVLELKPTVESNSTWMYTITGVAVIVVIIGVSIALYFQNKNKESQRIENMPLLNNKV